MNVGDAVDYFTGAISGDAQVFFVVDTDGADNEVALSAALKKTK